MTGVVFIISIPSRQYEEALRKKCKRRAGLSRTTSVSSKFSNHNEEGNGTSTENLEPTCGTPSISSDCMSKLEAYLSQYCEDIDTDDAKNETSSYFMEDILLDTLKQLKVNSFTLTSCVEDKYVQVVFPLESGDRCEEVLGILRENKIGQKFHSAVSVIPCCIYYNQNADIIAAEDENDEELFDAIAENEKLKRTAWNRFVTSIKTRLTVAEVVENVKANATLTFDFICLLSIATILCAIGLVENSSLYLISSMLISPMMGPVMASTFGSVIRDIDLQKTGVLNELIGLGIATAIGFLYGIIISSATSDFGQNGWPTTEMISRGEFRTLWVGCLIALLSGAAVALGILGDNIASLVGVAISTSLMPPAVNAGLLWAIALTCYVSENEIKISSITETRLYSKNKVEDLAIMGAISMCLTFVNIICIYLAGICIFKIKEVAPIATKDSDRRRFWKHDIKVARDYNRTLQNEEAKQLRDRNPYIFYKNIENQFVHHSADLDENHHEATQKRRSTWSSAQLESKRGNKKSVDFKRRDLKQIFGVNPKEQRFVGKTKVFTVVPCDEGAGVSDS